MTVPLRPIEIVRAVWGASLVIAPVTVLRRVHGVRVDTRSVVVARVLGARHLGQAVLSGINPSAPVLALGVWVDTVHAATALGLAAVNRDRIRAGITDALIAGAFAGFGVRDLRRGAATRPSADRWRDVVAARVLALVPGGAALRRLVPRARTRAAMRRAGA